MNMNMWTAIVIIVAIGGLVRIFQARHGIAPSHLHNRKGQSGAGDQQAQTEQPQLSDPAAQRELEDLRERVKVLERIVTDANNQKERHSRAIADEIESLRDR